MAVVVARSEFSDKQDFTFWACQAKPAKTIARLNVEDLTVWYHIHPLDYA